MLRFSANLGFLWRDLPLTDRVRRAKEAGFDAVEFHYPYDVPVEEMRTVLQEASLPVAGLNTRPGDLAAGDMGLAALPGRESDARAAVEEAFAYAEVVQAGYVHVMAGKSGDATAARARETFLATLDFAARRAEQTGIQILIEPLNTRDAPGYFLKTSEQAAAIIAELGRPNVKILFDCYHTQISEGDLTRRFEMLLPIVGHVQIAAAPSRAEPDEGEVAYERVLRVMEAVGYSGFVGAEYRARSTVEAGLGWLAGFRGALG